MIQNGWNQMCEQNTHLLVHSRTVISSFDDFDKLSIYLYFQSVLMIIIYFLLFSCEAGIDEYKLYMLHLQLQLLPVIIIAINKRFIDNRLLSLEF